MPNLNIIDGNAIGYQCQNTNILTAGDMQTQAAFHFVKSMRTLVLMYPAYTPLVLWDRPATWRYDLHPDYKSNRKDDPKKIERREHYKKQRPYIQKAVCALGLTQMAAEGHEADDLAGLLNRKAIERGHKVLLTTGDGDWMQLVGKGTIWFDPIRDKICTIDNFAEMTGYATTAQFLDGKALQGDGSDTIPGIGGIGEKGAPEFLMQYESVENFFKLADEGKLPEKLPAPLKRLAENTAPNPSKKYGVMLPARDAYYRNMKLMDLRNVQSPSDAIRKTVKGTFNKDKFAEICEELAFHSILRTFDSWIKPFEERLL